MSKVTIAMVTCDLCGLEVEGQMEFFSTDLPERWFSIFIKEQEREHGLKRITQLTESILSDTPLEPEPAENNKRTWLSLDMCPSCYENKVMEFARQLNASRVTPAKDIVHV